jgi:hypothetical protein
MRFFLLSYLLVLFMSAAVATDDENNTISLAPSPAPYVFTGEACTKLSGCDCPEGSCNMLFCGAQCHCNGGECYMPFCTVDCKCPGGQCSIPLGFINSDESFQPAVTGACTSTKTCFCAEGGCNDCDGDGCTCAGSQCDLSACTENCSCAGSKCKMNSCTENCSCAGGMCAMQGCTKDCSCVGTLCDAAFYQTFQPWAAGLVACLTLFLSMN